jgi:hypothetical protein
VYNLTVTSTPSKRSGWEDLTKGQVEVNKKTGNMSRALRDGPRTTALHLTGDKHYHGFAATRHALYAMGAANTTTDSFSYIAGGLAPNNHGATFIGLPEDGPEKAPVLSRFLSAPVLIRYAAGDEHFPWDTYLPQAA